MEISAALVRIVPSMPRLGCPDFLELDKKAGFGLVPPPIGLTPFPDDGVVDCGG
jgi:hypothetical protein